MIGSPPAPASAVFGCAIASGGESSPRYGGTFPTLREARIRRDYIAGELAALRVPVLATGELPPTLTLAAVCEAWRASRIDVAEATRTLHRVALARFLPTLGGRDVSSITAADVAAAIAQLHGDGTLSSS